MKRSRYTDIPMSSLDIKPLGRTAAIAPLTPSSKSELKELPEIPRVSYHLLQHQVHHQQRKREVASIIAAASAKAALGPPPPPPPPPIPLDESGKKASTKPAKKGQTKEEKEANKEKRLLKLVGSVVVKCMSKYQKQMDHEQFKKHAKEVCINQSRIHSYPNVRFLTVNTNNCRQGEEVVEL
jgi:histone-lysine N-methyltransferase SETD2